MPSESTPWTPPGTPPTIAALPRFALLEGPSPLLPMPRLGDALGGRADLWIKREDLLPWAFGGNKLRNLEFHVGAALAGGADVLVTAGRRWSNHARLTAAAGARAGLEVHVVLAGPPADPPNPGRRLDELLGARVHQASTANRDERAELVRRVRGELRRAGRQPYEVPIGGSGAIGAAGHLLAGLELAAQAAERELELDSLTVVLPVSTGGTHAGLATGVALAAATRGARPPEVRGIVVGGRVDEMRADVARLTAELAALAGPPATPIAADDLDLSTAHLGPGYGHPTAEADAAATLLARTEGILLDPIYTAKALAGLVELVRSGGADGRTVVFWHAGGLPGLFEPLPGRAPSPEPDGGAR